MPEVELRVERTIGAHAPAWDRIVDTMALPSPFLRSWWIDATTRDGCVALVLRDGVLLGGLALEQRRVLGVELLTFAGGGALGRDHLDAVAAPRDREAVTEALRAWLRRPGTRLVRLDGAPEDALVAAALPAPVRRRVVATAPWTALPGRYEDFLAERPSGLRSNVRRLGRRLDGAGVRHVVVPPEHLDAALADLARFHRARYGYRSALLPRLDEFAHAVRLASERDEARIHELVVDGVTIAIEVWFEVAGVGSCYQIARDDDPRWKASGHVLKARAVEDMIERGIAQIDLLRADEPYKREWTTGARVLLALDAATGLRGRVLWASLPAARSVDAAARRVLGPVRRRLRSLRERA